MIKKEQILKKSLKERFQMTHKKLLCKLLIGCFCLSLSSLALADRPDQPPMPPCDMEAPQDRPDPQAMERHLSEQLQKLVDKNTITSEQSANLLAFFKEQDAQRTADMEKMKDMSPSERDNYLQKKFKQRPDMLSELKIAAGLSEEQARAVDDAIRPPHRPEADMRKHIAQSLAKLVSENTLTQEQAEKISAFFKQKEAERKADMEKAKDMTPAERDAFFKEKMSHHPDLVNDLKAAAGLSNEQAQTVADALRPHHPEPPMHPMP
jgi:hypothetical protein